MVDLKTLNKKLNPLSNAFWVEREKNQKQTISLDQMAKFTGGFGSGSTWNGDKFAGGFGFTKDYDIIDYWTLRARSKQLFTENLYARGIIRRLITNEINKGISLEATPDNLILKITDEDADTWAESVERRFAIWGKNPQVCDHKQADTFGAIQRNARLMSIVSGDVLIILRQGSSKVTSIELVDAEFVQTPNSDKMHKAVKARGNTIEEGVELNQSGKHIAYFVEKSDGKFMRIPTHGARTGRKQAFLMYGTEKLINEVRGQSLLALTIQSLKEVDRYRDSEQRAAVINSMIAMFVKKGEDKIGSNPMTAGAVRKDSITTQDDSQVRKEVEFNSLVPGMMLQEMQHGEEPVSYDTKRPNVNFAVFEEAIINTFAWANQMPPEILKLGFSSNYSASQAAVSEFKMYLDVARSHIADQFLDIVYQDFLISEILNDNIQADGFLSAFRSKDWLTYGGWVLASWSGAVKPSIDMVKSIKAYSNAVDRGWVTNDRASKDIFGMKFSKVTQQVTRENKQRVKMTEPLIEGGLVRNENANTQTNEGNNS